LRCLEDNFSSHHFASRLAQKRQRLPIRKAGISPASAILFTVRGLHDKITAACFASISFMNSAPQQGSMNILYWRVFHLALYSSPVVIG
jgi:hypothetical protein